MSSCVRGEWAWQGRWGHLQSTLEKEAMYRTRFDFALTLHLILQRGGSPRCGSGGRLSDAARGRPSAGGVELRELSYRGVGTFSLQTYEDVALVKDAVADAVADRRMPPWKAVDGCTDYRDDISPTDEQIAMVEWADSARRRVTARLAGRHRPRGRDLERVDLSVQLPLPYAVDTSSTDDYRCFPVEWPLEEAFVTGYVVNADRAVWSIVIAYIIPGSYRDQLVELEAEDGRAGYESSVGRGPSTRQTRTGSVHGHPVSKAAAEWAGNPDESDDLLVLQMHYNSKAKVPDSDQEPIDFTIESSVEREGWIQPFTNPGWVFAGGWTFRHRRKARSRASRTPWRGTRSCTRPTCTCTPGGPLAWKSSAPTGDGLPDSDR